MDGWKQNEPLAQYTTFHVGGPADYFIEVATVEELQERVRDAKEHSLPITILGGGSNVLIPDDGIRGAVIRNVVTGITEAANGDSVVLAVGAGEVFDDLVAYTVQHGYWGIENLSHIPGSVGATPVQNVGAYGVEIGEYIIAVHVYDLKTQKLRTLSQAECAFGYRDSLFKHGGGREYVVTHVDIQLSRTPDPQLGYKDLAEWFQERTPTHIEIRDAVITIRSRKFPDWHSIGTAGSFFKNPIITTEQYKALEQRYPGLPGFVVSATHTKVPLGWILDKVCKLRGIREENVGTYEGQALVIINHGGATAHDIDAFAKTIEQNVLDATGITIEREVTMV